MTRLEGKHAVDGFGWRIVVGLATLAMVVLQPSPRALAQAVEGIPPAAAGQSGTLDDVIKGLFDDAGAPAGPDVFGYASVSIGSTPMDDLWRRAAVGAPPELGGEWAALVDRIQDVPVRTKIEAVNSFTNKHIAYASDQAVYGVDDYWAGLSETIAHGRGDCEDFAIAKMQLLAAAGVPQRDLYLILVRDTVRDADHAVLAVRDGDKIYVLDSLDDRVLTADQIKTYRPTISFSGDARWTFGVYNAALDNNPDALDAQTSAVASAQAHQTVPRSMPSLPPR